MALNRCVNPRRPCAMAAVVSAKLASLCPAEINRPLAASLAMISGRRHLRRERQARSARRAAGTAAIPRWCRAPAGVFESCTPRRARVEEWPLDVNAEHAGQPRVEADCTAAMARPMVSRSSLISVGRKPVVPKRRCAAPMARMESGFGSSLNSTPPPPLTCTSMNPGSKQLPLEIHDDGIASSADPPACGQRFDARARQQQRLPAHDSLTGQKPAVR